MILFQLEIKLSNALSAENYDKGINIKIKKKVAIVDDEDDIALAFKIGLEDNGYAVNTFNDHQEALLHFKPNTYDLMLLDIKMPKLNGLEFYYQMKCKDNNIRVCFITASEIFL
jgi:DNA-binding response OmpR family regulator